ncbi:MAG: helix-turn-helix transcriptional regulator [Flavobacteriaceae bacterium]|nr:helix-turn-helix transcriptional regulator [Flavobacteriaceae bacterium]
MNYDKIILDILDIYKLNASDLADTLGVQRSNISHIISGRNKPSLDFLLKVKSNFPELRWEFLLLGEKPMTISEKEIIDTRMNQGKSFRVPSDSTPAPTLFDELEKDELSIENELKQPENDVDRQLIKIVWFYSDQSFEVFHLKD